MYPKLANIGQQLKDYGIQRPSIEHPGLFEQVSLQKIVDEYLANHLMRLTTAILDIPTLDAPIEKGGYYWWPHVPKTSTFIERDAVLALATKYIL